MRQPPRTPEAYSGPWAHPTHRRPRKSRLPPRWWIIPGALIGLWIIITLVRRLIG